MTNLAQGHNNTETDPVVTLTVDGRTVSAAPGELLIDAAERAGVYIPRFCYHPRMQPVGMCRMCLVEVSSPRGFSLQPACFISVQEGQEIRTSSAPAKKAQEGVLEFLLVNHPLDCPVCDKGGECPLQDQSMSHGPGESRFVEEKRHWAKPIDIGPFVALDRERCIQCARCTRFADEIAGDASIDFAFRSDYVEVATFPGLSFDSYFSGNTVQICPVGALTARPYRFKSRPWDLEQVETTCTACSVGCRVVAQSSAGALVRYLGVDSAPVNQSWLCDKGRFSYEAETSTNRLVSPLLQQDGSLIETTWNQALDTVSSRLREVLDGRDPSAIAVIGGAHFSNEDAYAWTKFAKGIIGTDSVDAQIGDGISAEVMLGLPRATIDETTSAKLVITLAPDLREELPVLYLRLRAAAKFAQLKVLECSPSATGLSGLAAMRLSFLPGEVVRVARSIVGSGAMEEVPGAELLDLERARKLVGDVDAADGSGIVVVLGRASLGDSGDAYGAAALAIHEALPGVKFLSALRRGNVHGALDMGMAPGLLPGRVGLDQARSAFESNWEGLPEQRGRSTREILKAAGRGEIGVLILLGADPLSDFPDRGLVEEAFVVPPFIVALGTHHDSSNARSDVVLPVAGDGERGGTTTNLEGRVTRLSEKVVAPGVAWPAWVVAHELARRLGADLGFASLDAITDEIGTLAPAYRGLSSAHLSGQHASDGVLVPLSATSVSINGARPSIRPLDPMATPGISSVDEQGAPLRVGRAEPVGGTPPAESASAERSQQLPKLPTFSPDEVIPGRLDAYSLRLVVQRRLYDRGTLVQASPSLAGLAVGQRLLVHPSELQRLGLSSGDRLRVRSAKGQIVIEATADDSVARNVAVLLANLGADNTSANQLIDATVAATDVRLESI